jgi:CheY-like chemotaxis protein
MKLNDRMKRILFLDDDTRRTAEFLARFGDDQYEITTVETADECIARLAGGTFDLVLLDHDLGGEIFCDSSREDCGMEVVRWLKRNGGSHGAFIIHTMNPVAGAAMYLDLKAIGFQVVQASFGTVDFYQNINHFLDAGDDAGTPKESFGEKLTKYFRSLRLGR